MGTETNVDLANFADVLFTSATGTVGRGSVVCAAVIDGTRPLEGATVTASVVDPRRQLTTLTLLDDGGEVDGAAGDGLYCAGFVPAVAGVHRALAEISSGPSIRRQTAGQLTVDNASASLTAAVITASCGASDGAAPAVG